MLLTSVIMRFKSSVSSCRAMYHLSTSSSISMISLSASSGSTSMIVLTSFSMWAPMFPILRSASIAAHCEAGILPCKHAISSSRRKGQYQERRRGTMDEKMEATPATETQERWGGINPDRLRKSEILSLARLSHVSTGTATEYYDTLVAQAKQSGVELK